MRSVRKNKIFEFFRKKKLTYIDAEIVHDTNKAIIACKQCGQKLKVPLLENKKLRITCSKCRHEFSFDCKRYKQSKKILVSAIYFILLLILVIDIAAPIYFFPKVTSATTHLKHKHEVAIKEKQDEFAEEIRRLQDQNATTIKNIDPTQLRLNAYEHYAKIWNERKKYVGKYAITPREKAQLEMLALSRDRTKRIEDIIKGIALKAAPRNSKISVNTLGDKYALDIDFDMSELTSGEEGTRTKHSTVESLKKDTIRLISKVTNDVYQFCQNLDLNSISIGCRHYVREYNEYNYYTSERNTVLYKIRLDKKDLAELKNNPFLDTYSTTKYFKIEEDNFPNIKITFGEIK